MKKPETIAYLGPEYTFCHGAALEKYGSDSTFVPCKDISAVFQAVGEGNITHANGYVQYINAGVVPYRNIKGGDVIDTLDLMLRWHTNAQVNVVDSISFPIVMDAGGLCQPEEVTTILSHIKGLHQCRDYIGRFPNATPVETDSTARGVELIASGDPLYRNAAALASPEAFRAYGVQIYEESVADVQDNKTRFLCIKRDTKAGKSRSSKKDITTVAIVPNHPIYHFSTELFDLLRRCQVEYEDPHLRPTGKDMDIHYFDLRGHAKFDDGLQNFFRALDEELPFKGNVEVHNLGSYGYDDFYPSLIWKIAIIGASKGRGATLRDFIRQAGYKVDLADHHIREKTQEQMDAKRSKSIVEIATNANVILLNTYRKHREEAVRNVAPFVYGGRLLVVNSNKLAGEEEIVRGWIENEVRNIFPDMVTKYRQAGSEARTSTEKFVRTALKKYDSPEQTQTDAELVEALVREHCDGIQFLGMDTIFNDSFRSVEGQSVVFTPTEQGEKRTKTTEFMDIFRRYKVDVVVTDPETHDNYRGMAKNLSTLNALVVLETIMPGYDLNTLMRYSTPDTRLFFNLLVKLISGSHDADTTSMAEFDRREQFLSRFERTAETLCHLCRGSLDGYQGELTKTTKRVRGNQPAAIETVKTYFNAVSGRGGPEHRLQELASLVKQMYRGMEEQGKMLRRRMREEE